MRCRHCGVRIRHSSRLDGQTMYADEHGWWTCEHVGQGMGGTNHEPDSVFDPDAEIPIAAPQRRRPRRRRRRARLRPPRCVHCGRDLEPSTRRPGQWRSVVSQTRQCRSSPSGRHEIPDGNSVNAGRLDVNVGRPCDRCGKVIQQGERSHRTRTLAGLIRTLHLNPVCHRSRDERGRFVNERGYGYTTNYTASTIGTTTSATYYTWHSAPWGVA